MTDLFKKDVLEGLSQLPKRLSSKYFYDEQGDQLFQKIMDMEDYYLPACEHEIIRNKTEEICRDLTQKDSTLSILELGAGDGRKTAEFLNRIPLDAKNIRYYPMDISPNVLEINQSNMENSCPGISIFPIAGDYFETMKEIKGISGAKLVLFLGSNIGNYPLDASIDFMKKVKSNLTHGDSVLVAFDLKKNPHQILAAYNDLTGITKEFNLNLLTRMNGELGADFNIDQFDHYATYDPLSGKTSSFIVSLSNQAVTIDENNIRFKKDEIIHVEISQKYDYEMIESLAEQAHFKAVKHFTDMKMWYSLSLFQV